MTFDFGESENFVKKTKHTLHICLNKCNFA